MRCHHRAPGYRRRRRGVRLSVPLPLEPAPGPDLCSLGGGVAVGGEACGSGPCHRSSGHLNRRNLASCAAKSTTGSANANLAVKSGPVATLIRWLTTFGSVACILSGSLYTRGIMPPNRLIARRAAGCGTPLSASPHSSIVSWAPKMSVCDIKGRIILMASAKAAGSPSMWIRSPSSA